MDLWIYMDLDYVLSSGASSPHSELSSRSPAARLRRHSGISRGGGLPSLTMWMFSWVWDVLGALGKGPLSLSLSPSRLSRLSLFHQRRAKAYHMQGARSCTGVFVPRPGASAANARLGCSGELRMLTPLRVCVFGRPGAQKCQDLVPRSGQRWQDDSPAPAQR